MKIGGNRNPPLSFSLISSGVPEQGLSCAQRHRKEATNGKALSVKRRQKDRVLIPGVASTLGKSPGLQDFSIVPLKVQGITAPPGLYPVTVREMAFMATAYNLER